MWSKTALDFLMALNFWTVIVKSIKIKWNEWFIVLASTVHILKLDDMIFASIILFFSNEAECPYTPCWLASLILCRVCENESRPPEATPAVLTAHCSLRDTAVTADTAAGQASAAAENIETLQPGAVARSCNPATWRQVLLDGLRRGLLVVTGSCWSGVRTKACINMDPTGEPEGIRLTKEGRTGPGGTLSSQESPCRSVVG